MTINNFAVRSTDLLREEYESFIRMAETPDATTDIEQGKRLLEKIRESGRDITDPALRDTYVQMARSLGERLYILTGDYLPIRLEPPPQNSAAAALHDQNPAALPAPLPPMTGNGKLLAEVDPELYKAWRSHISEGFANNNIMFRRVLNAFLYPYWLAVALYVVLVLVGVGLFLLGVWFAIARGDAIFGVISGGLGMAALLAFFVSRPLQSLEENLQFITWLGVIYNTYWSQLASATNADTVKQDLEEITQSTIGQIKELQSQHAALSGARFKLP